MTNEPTTEELDRFEELYLIEDRKPSEARRIMIRDGFPDRGAPWYTEKGKAARRDFQELQRMIGGSMGPGSEVYGHR